MQLVTCSRCGGSGLYRAPSSLGPSCFACKGTGRCKPSRPRKVVKRELPPTRRIADICAGDPTKLALDNTRALDYLGLTPERLIELRHLWEAGVREVPR